MKRKQRILIATDGSPSASEAIAATAKFPWPEGTSAQAVLATGSWLHDDAETTRRLVDVVATEVKTRLRRRWMDVPTAVSNETAVKAILAEADRCAATTIVLGWRGHGTFERLLAGSVSREVAMRASCPVLIVRKAPQRLRRYVLAYDGSNNAEKAVQYLSKLQTRRGCRIVVLTVTRPLVLPTAGRLPPRMRAELRQSVAEHNQQQLQTARDAAASVVDRLSNAGWSASSDVQNGAPVAAAIGAIEKHRADVVVVGATTKSIVQRAMLGSIAQALLDRSPVPILIVR